MTSVTVITLSYNNVNEIFKTIKSVFSQENSEVDFVQYIIADDGSSFFPKDDIKLFYSSLRNDKISKVEVYSNDVNIGTVKSLNKAVTRSKGDIIVPLSCGDEFFSADSIDQIVECFGASNAQLLTGFRQIVADGKAIRTEPGMNVQQYFRKGNERELLRRLVLHGNFISGASTYYSRLYLNSVGGFDENFRLLEDYPFYLKVLNNGDHITFNNNVFMRHSLGGVTDTSKPRNQDLKKDFELLIGWVLKNIPLSRLEKRFVSYNLGLTRTEKLSLKNILRFPDCFLRKIFGV